MTGNQSDLDPIKPERAQELYLRHKGTESTEATVRNHMYRTNHFVQWCAERDLENLNSLTGRDVHEYRLWRQEQSDLKTISLTKNLSTIRVFLEWCGTIEAVPTDLHEKVTTPQVSAEQEQREEMLEAETAQDILDYLSRYHYASTEHVILALLWETGIRIGAAHSIDVHDVDDEAERIDLVHRPEQGTRLKNKRGGERPIAISTSLRTLLVDYIEDTRTPQTDDHGREPFLTTVHGRMPRGTMRQRIYRTTAPCFRNEPCPDCTGTDDSKCGEAVSPHAVRRGSITHFLSEDVPVEVVGDRMNVSRDVLDKHYDKRSEEVKLEQRRGYLDNI